MQGLQKILDIRGGIEVLDSNKLLRLVLMWYASRPHLRNLFPSSSERRRLRKSQCRRNGLLCARYTGPLSPSPLNPSLTRHDPNVPSPRCPSRQNGIPLEPSQTNSAAIQRNILRHHPRNCPDQLRAAHHLDRLQLLRPLDKPPHSPLARPADPTGRTRRKRRPRRRNARSRPPRLYPLLRRNEAKIRRVPCHHPSPISKSQDHPLRTHDRMAPL